MDELVQRLGMAVSNISACVPSAEAWSGPAATALTAELEQISAEIGGLVLDLLFNGTHSLTEQLQLG